MTLQDDVATDIGDMHLHLGVNTMTGGQPICSVIIPTHNRRVAVVRAIDSALASVCIDSLEVVVVDDASTDNTQSLLNEIYGRNGRVRWLVMPENIGPSGARNQGLLAAKGEFVLFLDSDDELKPDALACALEAFRQVPMMQFLTLEGEAVSVDLCTYKPRFVRDSAPGWRTPAFKACVLNRKAFDAPAGAANGRLDLEFGDLFPAIVFGDLFWLSGLMLRRTAAQNAGPFNVRYRYLEDWDFAARLCRTGIGGYLDHVGFRREMGRTDHLSRAGNNSRSAVMHERIVISLHEFDGGNRKLPRHLLSRARAAADYCLACRLLERHHRHRAQAFLWRAFSAGHQPFKTLMRIMGGERITEIAHYLLGRSSMH